MKLLQVTNIISHHQLPLARWLVKSLGENSFRFAATEPPLANRLKLGWNTEESEPWILRAGENEAHRSQFDEWWDEADVVIAGYRNVDRLADRVRRRKLTFYLSERWWKPPIGMARLLHPRFAWMAYRFSRQAQSPWFHYLPIGGYAATDMHRMTSFRERTWDWGYFTSVPNPLPRCLERDGEFRIMWAGRMLSWKHVETLVWAFAVLLRHTPQSRLILIGDGPCRVKLRQMTRKLGITDSVDFFLSMPTRQVRDQMRNSHVYVLPSNGYEGWGAVLNEAMSEGCAIVACEDAGSARTMLRHGENGLLFKIGDHRQLARLLVKLCSDEPLRRQLAEAGQRTISECWSPDVAAERLLAVSDALLSKRPAPIYPDGPMARLTY